MARYGCYGDKARHGLEPCGRRISAGLLESFVADAAVALLERLTVTGGESAALLSAQDHAAIEADRAEIAELKDMWDRQEIRTAGYRQMRKVVEDRIRKIEAKTVIRPGAEVLDGFDRAGRPRGVGSAGSGWGAGAAERRLAVLARCDPDRRVTRPLRQIRLGRIEIEQNAI